MLRGQGSPVDSNKEKRDRSSARGISRFVRARSQVLEEFYLERRASKAALILLIRSFVRPTIQKAATISWRKRTTTRYNLSRANSRIRRVSIFIPTVSIPLLRYATSFAYQRSFVRSNAYNASRIGQEVREASHNFTGSRKWRDRGTIIYIRRVFSGKYTWRFVSSNLETLSRDHFLVENKNGNKVSQRDLSKSRVCNKFVWVLGEVLCVF